MIDRIGPTLRPDQKPVGFQKWRSLLFMHWAIPEEVLRPLVPESLELDLFDGVAYVGVVPFAMRHVRPWWCPEGLSFQFFETNVRTYVTYRNRPGVYFFSLDAASRIGVWVARKFWGLPYHFAEMSLKQVENSIAYSSVRPTSGVRHDSHCLIGESLAQSVLGSIEFFFLERYLLFLEQAGIVLTGQVHHRPYPVRNAEILSIRDDLLTATGFESCTGLPEFAHYSTGVDVEIYGLEG